MNEKACDKTVTKDGKPEEVQKSVNDKKESSVLPRCPDYYCFEDGM